MAHSSARVHGVGLTLEQKGTKETKNSKTENPVMLQLNDVMCYMPILRPVCVIK